MIAIVGILATVARSSYESYQAKARGAEAKIHLANLYTSEKDFWNKQQGFTSCSATFGYTGPTTPAEFYAFGFEYLGTATCGPVYNMACIDMAYSPVHILCPVLIIGSQDTQGMASARKSANSLPPTRGLDIADASITPLLVGMPARGMIRGASQSSFTALALGRVSGNPSAGFDFWSMTQNKKLTHERFAY